MARRDVWETHTNSLFKPPPSMRAAAMPASSMPPDADSAFDSLSCTVSPNLASSRSQLGKALHLTDNRKNLLHREPRECVKLGHNAVSVCDRCLSPATTLLSISHS